MSKKGNVSVLCLWHLKFLLSSYRETLASDDIAILLAHLPYKLQKERLQDEGWS